jgi:tRNA(Ile)-lysidine synthase
VNLHPTEKKVLSSILKHRMIRSGDKVVVGVSGGPDSVCLLNIMYQLRTRLKIGLIVAHLDHGLRPGEDEKETELVARLARELDLTFAWERVTQLAKVHRASLEERAREIRYGFFERVLREHHAQKLAIGHNMNDQAETVLMHILRGTGLAGLSGIPPIRGDHFIRPLLGTTRQEIQAYLRERHLPYMIDSSNLEKRYLRNKIRLDLIPALLPYQPRLVEHLHDLSSLSREENRYMDREAETCLKTVILNSSEHSLRISLAAFKSLPTPLQYRIIRKAIKMVKGNLRRIDLGHIKAVDDLVKSSRPQIELDLPENLIVKKEYERLSVSLGPETQNDDFSYPIEGLGRFQLGQINMAITCEEHPGDDFGEYSPSPWEECFDLDILKWPLILRNYRAGDRFMPLGLNGFKKLKDVFIDNKIPSRERRKIPILESCGDIMWVCGIRIDERYRVRGGTKRILRCKIESYVVP